MQSEVVARCQQQQQRSDASATSFCLHLWLRCRAAEAATLASTRRYDKRADYVYLNVLLLQLCFMRLLRSTAAATAGVAASAALVGAVVRFSYDSSVRPSCRFHRLNILQNFLAFAFVFLFLSTYCSFYSCYFCAHRLQIKFLALNLKFSV